MTTIEKNSLFTEITEEEYATVSGGDNLIIDTEDGIASSYTPIGYFKLSTKSLLSYLSLIDSNTVKAITAPYRDLLS